MVTGKISYKRKRLTSPQKALKKALTPLVREYKASIKADMPKMSGALKSAVDYKIVSKGGWSIGIVGVRSKFTKAVNRKTEIKLPNLYALKIETKYGIIKRYINQDAVQRLQSMAQKVLQDMVS